MSYRANSKEDCEMPKENIDPKNIIHDMTIIWFKPNMDIDKCPFCNTSLNKYAYTVKQFCCPAKRFSQGLFWWKKICTKDTYHTHYICGGCNMHWIINKSIIDNPIKSVVML